MKITVLIIALLAGAIFYLCYSIVPMQFHKAVHQKIIPELQIDAKASFEMIDKNTYQTQLESKKFLISIKSISEFNFLENHVLATIKFKNSETVLKAKIYGKLGKNFELIVDLEDYIDKSKDNLIALKPSLKFVLPLHPDLLRSEKRIAYLVSTTDLIITIDKFEHSRQDPINPKNLYFGRIEELLWQLSAESDLLVNSFKITNNVKMKSASYSLENKSGAFKNFEQSISFDSFDRKALIESNEKLVENIELTKDLPLSLKLGMFLGDLNKIIVFPFKLKNRMRLDHESGPASLDLNIEVKKFDNYSILQSINATFRASSPVKLFEDQLIDTLSETFTEYYKRSFYLANIDMPKDADEMTKKFITILSTGQQMPAIFAKFLNEDIGGTKRAKKLLDNAVKLGIMGYKDDVYEITGEFSGEGLLLNGKKDAFSEMLKLIPRQEIVELMIENGFLPENKHEVSQLGIPAPQILKNIQSSSNMFQIQWFHEDKLVPTTNLKYFADLNNQCLTESLEAPIRACQKFIHEHPEPIARWSGFKIKSCKLRLETNPDFSKITMRYYLVGTYPGRSEESMSNIGESFVVDVDCKKGQEVSRKLGDFMKVD